MFFHQVCEHNNDVKWALIRFKSPVTRLSSQQLSRPPPPPPNRMSTLLPLRASTAEIVSMTSPSLYKITLWGRVTHIWFSELTTIGLANGLSPGRCQSTIWTNVGTLSSEPVGIKFSQILNRLHTFSFKKMHLKMSLVKLRPFRLGSNVLKCQGPNDGWIFQQCILWMEKSCH